MAQTVDTPYLQAESQLKQYFTELYKSENDKAIDSLNNIILKLFSENLQTPESLYFKWDNLNMIGKLHSPDQKLNVYTWYLRNSKGNYSYFGYIQYNMGNKKNPESRLFNLTDRSKGMKNPETLTLSPENWLGCVYFNVFEFRFRRNTYYSLLGYNFNNDFSDKKYIEQLSIDKEGVATFGGEFRMELQKVKRVILEYSAQLVASVKYNEALEMIVFDHLSPLEPMLTGNYRFYGPDGSYDGLRFHKGEFVLQKDVDARNVEVK